MPVLLRLLFCLPLAAATAHGQALHDHDNSPLAGIFGLPDATEGGAVLAAGDSAWGVYLGTASHSVADEAGGEAFIADGETTRLELSWRRGFGERLEAGIEIPYLTHQAGGLDSVIDGWHDFFGLPEGARDERPRDVLEYAYANGGAIPLDYSESAHGLGDVRLVAGYRLRSSDTHRVALRFGLKLPTGDEASLLGSGATDASIGIAGDLAELGGSVKWSAFYRLHAVFLGEPEFLADYAESIVVKAAGGIGWQPVDRFGLTAQLAVRSASFDSDIEMLGGTPVALTIGGRIRLSERLVLDLAFGEDVNVGSTPDITFQAAVHFLPD